MEDKKSLVKVNEDSFVLDADLLASIRINGGSYNAFEPGEPLVLTYTGRDEESLGRTLPIMNVSGRMLNVERIANFIVDDEKLEVENEGTSEECLKFGSKPSYLIDYIKDSGKMPRKMVVTRRIAAGATQSYLKEDDERTEIMLEEYKKLDINVEGLENFPLMRYLRSKDRFYIPKHVVVEFDPTETQQNNEPDKTTKPTAKSRK